MAKVWSGRDGGRGCCEEVEAKGQVSRVGGHGVVSQARGADLKPPSPVGSAEQVLVIFSFMIPLLTPCMCFLKLWSIRSQNYPEMTAQAPFLLGKPAGQVHWCQSRVVVEQVSSRVRTAAKEQPGPVRWRESSGIRSLLSGRAEMVLPLRVGGRCVCWRICPDFITGVWQHAAEAEDAIHT